MNQLSHTPYLLHSRTSPQTGAAKLVSPHGLHLQAERQKQRVMNELTAAGIKRTGLLYSEARYLPHVLHEDEHLEAAVCGRSEGGRAMLIATDRRVIYLDKKPLLTNSDEVTYDLVGGVSYVQGLIFTTATLHTRIGDYRLRTTNQRSAKQLRDYIERRCLEHKLK